MNLRGTAINSRWIALVVLCFGFLLIVVDSTIVNVALPSIGRDLHFTQAGLAWVVNAYLIAFAGLLLLTGRLGDLVGRKRIFLVGLAVFTGASVLCGLSINQPMLVASRFLQGAGGAASSSVILAMIVNLFPEPDERARAFGLFGVVASAGAAIGLLAGGLITQAISWHWIFFVNLPLGIATAAAATWLLKDEPGIGLAEGADAIGALLVTAALMLGVYTIVQSSDAGLASLQTVGLGALAVALLAAFLVRQALISNPIMPLRLFRSRKFSGANVIQALMAGSFFGFFFMGALDMQRVLGYGPLAIGLAFLPVAGVMGALGVRWSASLIIRFGPRTMLLVGLVLLGAALAWLGFGPLNGVYARDLFIPLALLGTGAGLSFPALTMIAMSDASPSDSGLASGIVNTTGQVGGALGLAVLATLAGGRTSQLLAEGQGAAAALGGGYHFAWLVGAGMVAVTIVIAVALLRSENVAHMDGAREADEAAA
jgi:EmrB/QacA subfamily drug resistance transporter